MQAVSRPLCPVGTKVFDVGAQPEGPKGSWLITKTERIWSSFFSQKRERLQKKWIDLGLPKKVSEASTDCLKLLFRSGVAYQMAAASRLNPALETIRWNQAKKEPEVLVEGSFLPWSDFYKQYTWLPYVGPGWLPTYCNRENKDEHLSCTATQAGFVKKSRFTYEKPFPIAELQPEQLLHVKKQAALFHKETKNLPHAVLQVYTTPDVHLPGATPDDDSNHLAIASHYGVRLISNTGEVYSIGYIPDEALYLLIGSPAATVDSAVQMLDYDEFRRFDKRYVTSVPLTESQYTKAMRCVEEKHQKSVFSFGRNNCVAFAHEMLEIAGVRDIPPLTMPMETVMLSRYVIGPLSKKRVVASIARVVAQLFFKMRAVLASSWCMPPLVCTKKIAVRIGSYAAVPLQKVFVVFKWFLLVMLGGRRVSSSARTRLGTEAVPHIRSWKGMFDAHATDAISGKRLFEWQKRQASTKVHSYRGPELTVL